MDKKILVNENIEVQSGDKKRNNLSKPQIHVYTKSGCGGCTFTKKWLESRDISYVEHNVEDDLSAKQDLQNYGFKSLPVVAVGSLDTAWSGFNPDKLEGLEGILGKA